MSLVSKLGFSSWIFVPTLVMISSVISICGATGDLTGNERLISGERNVMLNGSLLALTNVVHL